VTNGVLNSVRSASLMSVMTRRDEANCACDALSL
jgi:hypothetical protein